LADCELGLRADPDEPRLVLAESVVVRNPEPLQRCPRLALGRDVLALIFADGALNRWSVTRRILLPQALQMNAGMMVSHNLNNVTGMRGQARLASFREATISRRTGKAAKGPPAGIRPLPHPGPLKTRKRR
jgi:hypothetical protein